MKRYAMPLVFLAIGAAAGYFVHPNNAGVGVFFAILSALGK